ncbi:MAG: mandelate racemase/muconate lactonizing enzyme family protein [Chloroflexi bacterium]|nr:mandelate racemase/muconate lactonizing enzyme family protein [Chloroflexota bacterium]
MRKGNRTVYPKQNRSLVVRLITHDGVEGWGETYGLVTPQATAAIINDLLAGFVIGRNPFSAEDLHDELYSLMRVRGYTGGFYLDALAAVDIALWDIAGKISNCPVSELLGTRTRHTIPAYVSGLPEDTLAKRCELAASWQQRGFDSFKFALPVADEGAQTELQALRLTLGQHARIACDLHWTLTQDEAIKLAHVMAPNRPWFLEAPVATEEIAALRDVFENANQAIAVGEEWRTLYDARLRIEPQACHIVQPEMGHTGITQFMRIGRYAKANNLLIMPHATIGSGIFLAASLQASIALDHVTSHEFQHSIFEPFSHFTGNALHCENGVYTVPATPGLGVSPSDQMRKAMELIKT